MEVMNDEHIRKGKQILVVEDHPESVELLRIILEDEDYSVQSVETGRRAIQAVSAPSSDETMARSSPRALTKTGWRHWSVCAAPASPYAVAASSGWVSLAGIVTVCCNNSPTSALIPKVCRSICWCVSRARRWPNNLTPIP